MLGPERRRSSAHDSRPPALRRLRAGRAAALLVLGLLAMPPSFAARDAAGASGPPSNPAVRLAPAASGRPDVDPRVAARIARSGEAAVIIALDDGLAPDAWAAAPRAGAAALDFERDAADAARAAQSRMLAAMPEGGFEASHEYLALPALAGMLRAPGLAALASRSDVLAIGVAESHRPSLAEHVPIVGGDRATADYGVTGEGVTVAVFDTGIDTDHPDLEDHLVAQQCYSVAGGCGRNNATQGTDAEDENGHGTAVAGIITSGGRVSPPGIAPNAGIVAMRVFDDRARADNRDIVSGLDWVLRNYRAHDIKVINMSLGSTAVYTGRCDDEPSEVARAEAISRLLSRGIVTFAASGNGAATNAMSAPACITKVISVGATYDADLGKRAFSACTDESTAVDMITCFTNRNRSLSVLAPGSITTLPVMGGGARGGWSGTSMASPMAAGAAALLFEADPGLRASSLERLLKDTGVPIEDHASPLTVPRIDVHAALVELVGPPPTPAASPTPTATPTATASPSAVPTGTPTTGPSPTAGTPLPGPSPSATGVPATPPPSPSTPSATEERLFLPLARRG